jgi:ABC-type uncharacterized transport system auxiliary subunit
MKLSDILRLVALLTWCVIAGGCSDVLKTPYPAKSYFLIDPGHPAGDDPLGVKRLDGVLKVRQLRAAAPYDGSEFVYKTGPNQYSSDYYAAFLMPTDRMLSAETREWLSQSGVFHFVVDAQSSLHTRYTLEGNVSGIYADLTDRSAPRAVMQAQFFLFSNDDAGPQILFTQSYATSAPVKGDGPAGLVSAWNEAFRTMLKELTADLSHNVPATTQATALR